MARRTADVKQLDNGDDMPILHSHHGVPPVVHNWCQLKTRSDEFCVSEKYDSNCD